MNNRIIKFRQRLQNDKWHYWGFIEGQFVSPMLADGIEDALKHSCRFTGLLDRNGVEVYEGDVIKNNDVIWEIYWSDINACYNMARNGKRTDNDMLFIGENQYSEVIGNIYTNLELLNSK